MAKRLTDKQKKRIIADYMECGNYSDVARKHKINRSTVKRLLENDCDTQQKAHQKKEENTADMIDFMDSRKDKAQMFVDMCFSEMLKPNKIADAKLRELATAMGIVIDKFTNNQSGQDVLQNTLNSIVKIRELAEHDRDKPKTD